MTGRTGGATTLSGPIADGADTGGGVALSGNTGGSTALSGAAKALNTGTADGVVMGSSGGHTLAISGGGLDVDATSGRGLDASGGGTLTVSGTGNTIDTTTGRALRVASTGFGAAGATFQRISANGAPNGIVLDGTGAAAGLTVTGAGGTCTAVNHAGCSGGTIAGAPGADDAGPTPAGTGIVLRDTLAPSLTRMWLHDHANYAIRGTAVAGFTLANSAVDGSNGTNGAGFDEAAVRFDGLTGTAAISSSTISGGYEDDLHVENASGSLDRLTITGTTFGLTSAAGGNDAVSLQSGAGAGAFKASILNSTFAGTRNDLVDFDHQGAGAGDLVLTGNTFANAHSAVSPGGGGLALSSGGSGATTMNVASNTFRDADGPAVLVVKAPGASTQTGSFADNTVGVAGVANSGSAEGAGLKLQNAGLGTMTWAVTGNQIRGYNSNGVELLAGGGASAGGGAVNATITGNTIAQPGTTASLLSVPKNGVHLNAGTQAGDSFQVCAAISGNDLAGAGADASPAAGQDFDVRLRQRFATTVRLPGYGGGAADTAAAEAFVAGLNPAGATAWAAASGAGGGFTGTGTTCP